MRKIDLQCKFNAVNPFTLKVVSWEIAFLSGPPIVFK